MSWLIWILHWKLLRYDLRFSIFSIRIFCWDNCLSNNSCFFFLKSLCIFITFFLWTSWFFFTLTCAANSSWFFLMASVACTLFSSLAMAAALTFSSSFSVFSTTPLSLTLGWTKFKTLLVLGATIFWAPPRRSFTDLGAGGTFSCLPAWENQVIHVE